MSGRSPKGPLARVEDAGGNRAAEHGPGARLYFEHSPLPMWVYDLETLRFRAVNTAAIAHYGYSRDEFLAMSIAETRPTRWPRFSTSTRCTPNSRIMSAALLTSASGDSHRIVLVITSSTR